MYLLVHISLDRLVPLLASAIKSNPDTKEKCYGYLDQIINVWPRKSVDDQIEEIDQIISYGLADENPKIRSTAQK